MKLSINASLIASLLAFGGASIGAAQTITFDSLPGTILPVPNGYEGLSWNGFFYLDGPAYSPDSGYAHGTVSGQRVAYNSFGVDASVTSAAPFDLTSLYLNAAWNDGLHVKIDGYFGGSLIYTNTYIVDATAPTFELLNYTSVDEVRFSSFGGLHHAGFPGNGTQFVVDNVTLNQSGFSAVPEPSTYGLAAAAVLAGLIGIRRRTKSNLSA